MLPNSSPQAPSPGQLVSVTPEYCSKSRRPGGVKREVGLQKAESTLISAHVEIRDELDSAFDATVKVATKLQSEKRPDETEVLRLRKHARHMRDVGSLAHYPLVTLIGALLVDVLNRQIEGQIKHRPKVLACFTDALVLAKGQALRDADEADVPELMSHLRKMIGTLSSS